MAILSTGPIENNIASNTGTRPTQRVTLKIDGRNITGFFDILILGYTLNGIRTLYVQEEISVAPPKWLPKFTMRTWMLLNSCSTRQEQQSPRRRYPYGAKMPAGSW